MEKLSLHSDGKKDLLLKLKEDYEIERKKIKDNYNIPEKEKVEIIKNLKEKFNIAKRNLNNSLF